ncbi:male sterility protein-domain-containing protein [Peziza echinospora]|nr:male sterility protein-domain-containing protein [Peziza echinospora]
MLLDYYNGRTILIPGGAGLVGTAICYKLVTAASPAKLYLLIRGKEERLWAQWRSVLPEAQYNVLRASACIVPISGDAAVPNTLGLSDNDLSALRENVTVIINLASNTRLTDTLASVKGTVIEPALCVAEVATTFSRLERFVWISSAYANAHLHWRDPQASLTAVVERMYPLSMGDSADAELAELDASGDSEAYRQNLFSSEFYYAKHLTERLLWARYRERLPHLLIVRPSCIGPALREPTPGFETLGTTPITTLMSFIVYGSANGTGAHHMPHRNGAKFQTLVNECPVDIVANRILAHAAHGTQGVTHAVVPGCSQLTLGDYHDEYLSTVPYRLRPKIDWIDDTALLAQMQARASQSGNDEILESEFGAVGNAFSFVGASYMFGDRKTTQLWQEMGEADRESLPLMVDGKNELLCALITRRKRPTAVIGRELTKYGFFATPTGRSEMFEAAQSGPHPESGPAMMGQPTFMVNSPIPSGDKASKVGGGLTSPTVGRYRFPQAPSLEETARILDAEYEVIGFDTDTGSMDTIHQSRQSIALDQRAGSIPTYT